MSTTVQKYKLNNNKGINLNKVIINREINKLQSTIVWKYKLNNNKIIFRTVTENKNLFKGTYMHNK